MELVLHNRRPGHVLQVVITAGLGARLAGGGGDVLAVLLLLNVPAFFTSNISAGFTRNLLACFPGDFMSALPKYTKVFSIFQY
jgi:hypothetical protein